ncbi:type II toxin-antitoxin system RelE/ParE family toxin [Rhizobium sp. S95]|uniref:Type II toxin-antitoxin system RelE/ParE family toxin n=1 Tax=Ciceribacter sichuanensis TaxID=2949647 RepID=A0AAJ1F9D4_9HYPH|nr:type II toxin-antitoxin system RelE/ParE family toxin [Ciceribacter sp. S95]MCO5959048.1 type II toxin-antitoxin system RelE/ParE family toxin [Ciceribacter sp. S101]
MLKIEWRQTAREDLLAIIGFITDHNPGTAQRLKDEILSKVLRLTEYPQLHRTGRVSGTREMVVHANYIVIYTENDTTISILRVLHGAQQWPPHNT